MPRACPVEIHVAAKRFGRDLSDATGFPVEIHVAAKRIGRDLSDATGLPVEIHVAAKKNWTRLVRCHGLAPWRFT